MGMHDLGVLDSQQKLIDPLTSCELIFIHGYSDASVNHFMVEDIGESVTSIHPSEAHENIIVARLCLFLFVHGSFCGGRTDLLTSMTEKVS